MMQGATTDLQAMQLAETLRDKLPGLSLQLHCGGGSFKSQMKKADKSGAKMALILGENELQNNTVAVKFLRENREQQVIAQDALAEFIQTQLKPGNEHA